MRDEFAGFEDVFLVGRCAGDEVRGLAVVDVAGSLVAFMKVPVEVEVAVPPAAFR